MQGNLGNAGMEVAVAVAAPAVMTYQAAANLVGDVVEGADELIGGLLARGQKDPGLEPAFPPWRDREAVCR